MSINSFVNAGLINGKLENNIKSLEESMLILFKWNYLILAGGGGDDRTVQMVGESQWGSMEEVDNSFKLQMQSLSHLEQSNFGAGNIG